MEKFCLSSTQSPTNPCTFLHPFSPLSRARKRAYFPITNPKKFSIFASKDESNNNNSKLDEWDLMELKFGELLGEDPKLTLAKVMGRKIDPDASYIQIEKNFIKNKGKLVEVKEVPFDVPEKLGTKKVANELNLVKPLPMKGIKVGGGGHDSPLPEIMRPSDSMKNTSAGSKSNVPNVILRKPSVFNENDDEVDSSLRMRIKQNLSLSMSTEPVKENFNWMTLLKKPHPSVTEEEFSGGNENNAMNGLVYVGLTNKPANDFEVPLLEKPCVALSENAEGDAPSTMFNVIAGVRENDVEAFSKLERDFLSKGRQLGEGSQTGKEIGTTNPSVVKTTASEFSVGSVVPGRPQRLDQSRKVMPYPIPESIASARPESYDGEVGPEKLPLSESLGVLEEIDWTRVEQLFKLEVRVDVELISCSPGGFAASFGSLIGFLPFRSLAAMWKFITFESWLRKNGLDPTKYRQILGVIGSDEAQNMNMSLESSVSPQVSQKAELKVTADMELEDLLRIYGQQKIQYLSSFVGQRMKVNILYADRKSRKLIFSMRPKETEETVEKKRILMKKLAVGDIVKCCIKKVTYLGIFVEVEGVPALVRQSELSWDHALNLESYPKIGEIVEAKVHQLDFALDRIFLSLKDITPNPLNEALESIVGNNSFNGGSEASQADSEWAEVDSLIKELREAAEVRAVSKGRFFLSPGLAPTFQVYMAPMIQNQYKLLARSGNKVQEVIVEASLDKEEMKSAILKCTNRVQL